MNDRRLGTVASALAATIFGSAYVATAFQLRGFTPLGGALWRSGLALVLLSVLAVWNAGRQRSTRDPATPSAPPLAGRLARLLVLGVLGGLFFVVGMNVAVSRVGATVTAFVAGLYAILAALFAPIVLSEKLERRAIGGFALALVGTILLAEIAPSVDTLGGLAAGGAAAVSFGLYLVLIRRWSSAIQVGPVGISLATAAVSTVGFAVILAVVDPHASLPASTTTNVVLATIWLALVTAVGPLLATAALRRIEASLASSLLLLNPVTATLLSVILLNERPSPPQLLGGLLVLVGMATSADLLGAARRRREGGRVETGSAIRTGA